MAVRAENECLRRLEPRMRDAIPLAGWFGDALLVHGWQVEIAAQHPVIAFHSLAGPALEIETGTTMDLARGLALAAGMSALLVTSVVFRSSWLCRNATRECDG